VERQGSPARADVGAQFRLRASWAACLRSEPSTGRNPDFYFAGDVEVSSAVGFPSRKNASYPSCQPTLTRSRHSAVFQVRAEHSCPTSRAIPIIDSMSWIRSGSAGAILQDRRRCGSRRRFRRLGEPDGHLTYTTNFDQDPDHPSRGVGPTGGPIDPPISHSTFKPTKHRRAPCALPTNPCGRDNAAALQVKETKHEHPND